MEQEKKVKCVHSCSGTTAEDRTSSAVVCTRREPVDGVSGVIESIVLFIQLEQTENLLCFSVKSWLWQHNCLEKFQASKGWGSPQNASNYIHRSWNRTSWMIKVNRITVGFIWAKASRVSALFHSPLFVLRWVGLRCAESFLKGSITTTRDSTYDVYRT